jgi:hypothetical protein
MTPDNRGVTVHKPGGSLLAMARPLVDWREPSPAERRDQHRPPGWGRNRNRGGW